MKQKMVTGTETMLESGTEIHNFGDARRFILQSLIDLREGKIGVNVAMAIAANMKVLNDNIQAEINLAKVTMIAHEKGHEFGRLVNMGKNVIDG